MLPYLICNVMFSNKYLFFNPNCLTNQVFFLLKMLLKSNVFLLYLMVMVTAFLLPVLIIGPIISSNGSDEYTFIPNVQHKIIVAFGPYDGPKQFWFDTDRKGWIRWNFWQDIQESQRIDAEYKNIASPEKVTILVENLHKAKRIISEFINYADMLDFMVGRGGKLWDSNSINFTSLAVAPPDPPNDSSSKRDKNEKPIKGKQKMIGRPNNPVEIELEINEVRDGKVINQQKKFYYGQLTGQNKKFDKEQFVELNNIQLDNNNLNDILALNAAQNGIELQILYDKNGLGHAVASTSKNNDYNNVTTSSYPAAVPPNPIMPDIMRNTNERGHRNKIYAKKIDVIGDGNCLFRAFAVSLYGRDNGIDHKHLRQSAAETLIKFESDPRSSDDQTKMKVIIRANLAQGDSMTNYRDSIAEYARRYVAKNGVYAGIAECQAMAIHLNRHVAVINSNSLDNSVNVFHPDFTQTEHKNITREKYVQLWELEHMPIVIWHDGNEHFTSIILKKKKSILQRLF